MKELFSVAYCADNDLSFLMCDRFDKETDTLKETECMCFLFGQHDINDFWSAFLRGHKVAKFD